MKNVNLISKVAKLFNNIFSENKITYSQTKKNNESSLMQYTRETKFNAKLKIIYTLLFTKN